LFCKNERAVLQCRLEPGGTPITLVAVAAILVASIRLHCVDTLLHLRYRGPNRIPCNAPYRKGQEMGWFQHGSTIVMFAPPGVRLCGHVRENQPIRQGQSLFELTEVSGVSLRDATSSSRHCHAADMRRAHSSVL
jgi:phosphatidylserine decarboxylase